MRSSFSRRFVKIQVCNLYKEGMSCSDIERFITRVNPNKYKIKLNVSMFLYSHLII